MGNSNKKKDFSTERQGVGTKEWAENNINLGQGCSHDCLYCYARSIALRFHRVTRKGWANEVIHPKKVNKGYRKRNGVIMFPTTHDISPAYLQASITVLKKLLNAGNRVLIVSKPHMQCIKEICSRFEGFKEQILFRFTIGTLDARVSRFWEPGAPLPDERINCLSHAGSKGYATSVSMEPMLSGTDDAIRTFQGIEDYVTEKIWIGKMRKARLRVDISRPDFLRAVEEIERLQSDEEIKRLHNFLVAHPKVAWKDSIKQVMGMTNK